MTSSVPWYTATVPLDASMTWATTGPSTEATDETSDDTSGPEDDARPARPGAHAAAVPIAAAPMDASRKNLRLLIAIRPPRVTTLPRVAPSTAPPCDLDDSAVRSCAAPGRAWLLRRHRPV